jgi:hypothetical protein
MGPLECDGICGGGHQYGAQRPLARGASFARGALAFAVGFRLALAFGRTTGDVSCPAFGIEKGGFGRDRDPAPSPYRDSGGASVHSATPAARTPSRDVLCITYVRSAAGLGDLAGVGALCTLKSSIHAAGPSRSGRQPGNGPASPPQTATGPAKHPPASRVPPGFDVLRGSTSSGVRRPPGFDVPTGASTSLPGFEVYEASRSASRHCDSVVAVSSPLWMRGRAWRAARSWRPPGARPTRRR